MSDDDIPVVDGPPESWEQFVDRCQRHIGRDARVFVAKQMGVEKASPLVMVLSGGLRTDLADQVFCAKEAKDLRRSLAIAEDEIKYRERQIEEANAAGQHIERQWWLDRLAALKASGYENEVSAIAAALKLVIDREGPEP